MNTPKWFLCSAEPLVVGRNNYKQLLTQILGIPEDATDEQIQAAAEFFAKTGKTMAQAHEEAHYVKALSARLEALERAAAEREWQDTALICERMGISRAVWQRYNSTSC